MAEVTLLQVLESRDNRAKKQQELLKVYNLPIISFTMNIAGPIKNSPLIERAFNMGIQRLKKSIGKQKIAFFDKNYFDTGCEAFFCVDMDSIPLKKICEAIEEESPVGRLFDIDVIDKAGNKLERKIERGCIVCGAPGKNCSASRAHSAETVYKASNKIMSDFFLSSDKKKIADLAVSALIEEVKTTPKPGLVDSKNQGSHSDMNIDTFIKSAKALRSYFENCFLIGHQTCNLSAEDIFPLLKSEGLNAEKTMYDSTGGVNTHKGIIYSMGILCAAIGRLWSADLPYKSTSEITTLCSDISYSAINYDFQNIDTKTAGGYYYKKCGIKGIRGEVLSGFTTIKEFSLPIYTDALSRGMSKNDAGVLTLIKLISCVDDTNLYNRGGTQGANFAKEYALSLLNENPPDFIKAVKKMDNEFIKRNLSPGGCADLLAITYFLYDIEKL